MKSTGIVRKIDKLGRIVLPKELRNTQSINIKDPVEISVDGECIVFKKYNPGCILCHSVNNELVRFENKYICHSCIQKIKALKY